jgi:hypothetical protein
LLVAFGLLLQGEAFEIGVAEQFVGERAIGAKEEMGGLLEAPLALGVHQASPPVVPGKSRRERESFSK